MPPWGTTVKTDVADNMFSKTEDAEKWATARGLHLNFTPPMGDLVLSSLHYRGSNGAPLQSFTTVGLFTKAASDRLAKLTLLDHIPPEFVNADVSPVAERHGEFGIFATQKITTGKRILVERPSLLLPAVLWAGGLPTTKDAILMDMFNRLSSNKEGDESSQLDGVRKLQNVKSSCSAEEGIVRTNGLGVNLEGEARPYTGVFANLSRCNHSCTPNAVLIWDSARLSMTLYSAYKIDAGQEITIAYTDILMSPDERNKALQLSHGFKCRCNNCQHVGVARQQSDDRRSKLREWTRSSNKLTFSAWLQLTKDPSTRKAAVNSYSKELQDLYEAIGAENLLCLKSIWMELADAVFRISMAKGELQPQRKKVSKTVKQAWKPYEGLDEETMTARTNMYDEWVEKPEECADWQCRTY